MSANSTSITELKNPAPREMSMPDQKIDMFSLRGFELACRIGKAFAASDAVPPIFRSHNPKKDRDGNITWVENTSALGNCVVAVETAQAVGVSITAVMQNANIIENRLTWSGKFVIAAVNASRRFTPLRFQMVNKGMMKARYREKQGWNNQKKGFDFIDKEVEIENIECTAWAVPYGMQLPNGIGTLQQAIAAGLPVIEGAPVSMAMAVEEGWYAKSGSKWQTGMKILMLQYRAGSFFGNIHAPDVVMGMGRTTEEMQDTIDFEPQPDGSYAVDLNKLRAASSDGGAVTEVSDKSADQSTSEVKNNPTSASTSESATETGTAAGAATDTKSQSTGGVSFALVSDSIIKATDIDVLDVAADLISEVKGDDLQEELRQLYAKRKEELTTPPTKRTPRTAPTVE